MDNLLTIISNIKYHQIVYLRHTPRDLVHLSKFSCGRSSTLLLNLSAKFP